MRLGEDQLEASGSFPIVESLFPQEQLVITTTPILNYGY